MKTIAAGKFKAQCLGIIDEVQMKRQSYVITKRGKPAARLIPLDTEKDDIFGFLKGKVRILGDIVAPAFSPEEWGDLYVDDRHARGSVAKRGIKPAVTKGKSIHRGRTQSRRKPRGVQRHAS